VVIAGTDLLDEVSRLKQAEGGDLLIWGTGQLTDALAAASLLDEYRICTSPVIKGGGAAVEVVAAVVVDGRGPGIGVAGGDLHVA
jgi:dihydrofolate reductase